MKLKIFFTFLILVALVVGGALGWMRLSEIREEKEIRQILTLAKGQMEDGDHERAQHHLARVLTEFDTVPDADSVWAKLAESYEQTGDYDKAMECWEHIRQSYRDSYFYPEALAALAEQAYRQQQYAQAAELWQTILSNHKTHSTVDDALFGKARLLYAQGDGEQARKALMQIREEKPDSNQMLKVEELLGQINLEMLYRESKKIHRIEPGDSLDRIGKKHNVSADLIAKMNGITNPRNLPVGRRLRIPETDFSIVVDKGENTLVLYNAGEFFKRYRCRTGKEDWMTPNGTFHIQRKVKDPQWNDPKTGRTYPPNHPENALGTRWLAFEGSLGIHGTIDPSTIGGYASNGCVGLLMEDVEELFDLVPVGTEVQITGKKKIKSDEKYF